MIYLEIDRPFSHNVDQDLLKQAAAKALKHVGIPPQSNLTLVITGDEHLRKLNRQFLDIDAATDVLSFPGGDTDPDTGEAYLGDILISYHRAAAQAEASNHPIETELQLLVVHGVLHLAGHDHSEPVEKQRMWRAQAEILNSLGISIDPSTYE